MGGFVSNHFWSYIISYLNSSKTHFVVESNKSIQINLTWELFRRYASEWIIIPIIIINLFFVGFERVTVPIN